MVMEIIYDKVYAFQQLAGTQMMDAPIEKDMVAAVMKVTKVFAECMTIPTSQQTLSVVPVGAVPQVFYCRVNKDNTFED